MTHGKQSFPFPLNHITRKNNTIICTKQDPPLSVSVFCSYLSYIHIGCTSDVQWLQDAAAGVYGDGWYCDDEVTPDCVDDECDSCQITPGCHAGPIWDSNNNVWVCSTEEEEGDDPDYTPAPAPQEQLYPTQASPATADSSEDYAVNDRRQFI
jgi:hypothetical protein